MSEAVEKIAIKLRFRNEFRRFQVPVEVRFKQLLHKIRKLCELSSFTLTYTDKDGDVVTIDSDYCLALAVGQARGDGQPLVLQAVLNEEGVIESSDEEVVVGRGVACAAGETPASAASSSVSMVDTAALANVLVPQIVEGVATRLQQQCRGRQNHHAHQGHHHGRRHGNQQPRDGEGVRHPHVVCDGCNGSIVGIRYKCMFCPDFDLCEACEDLDQHQPDHLFVKIRRPVPFGLQTSVYLDDHLFAGQAPSAPTTTTTAAADDDDICADGAEQEQFSSVCVTVASSSPTAPTTTTTTTTTSTSTTTTTARASESTSARDTPAIAAAAAAAVEELAFPDNAVPLFASFVEDVTLPDNSQVPVGLTVSKTWLVTNSGDHAWPAGTVLRHMDGPTGILEAYAVPPAQPSEFVNVTVDVVVPDVAGEYETRWVLTTPSGVAFGHVLWCQFIAVTPLSSNTDEIESAGAYDGCELSGGEEFEVISDTAVDAILNTTNNTLNPTTTTTTAAAAAAAAADVSDVVVGDENLMQTVGKQEPLVGALSPLATTTNTTTSAPTSLPPTSPLVSLATLPVAPPASAPIPVDSTVDFFSNATMPTSVLQAPILSPIPSTPAPAPAPIPAPVPAPTTLTPTPSLPTFVRVADPRLAQLAAMGFTDEALNETMLARNDGDVGRTVEELLTLS